MYALTPTTFDGTMLATDYEAKFLREHDPLCLVTEEPVETEVAGAFPVSPRSQPQSLVLPLYVRMKTTTQAALNAFKTLFSPERGDALLTATDGAAVVYRLTVRVINVKAIPRSIDAFIVRLYVAKPIFQSDTERTDTQTINASPTLWATVINAGTVRALPAFEVSPLVLRPHTDGYTRRWQVICAWRSELPASNYPVDIAASDNAGQIDYKAEMDAGRLLVSWNDIRVLVDGVSVDYYTANVGDAQHIRIWANLDFKPAISAVLQEAITVTSPANGGELAVDDTSLWPESGFFIRSGGYECYQYTSKTPTALCGIVRGARNTGRYVGPAEDVIYLVEHEIQVLTDYSNEAVHTPHDPDFAPVIDTILSTNVEQRYPGPYVAPGTNRSDQLLRAFYEDNLLSPLVSLDADNAAPSVASFRDTPPSGDAPQFNSLELYVPCGVKAAAAAITHDIVVNDLLGLEVFGTDIEGLEALLKRYCSTDDGGDVTLTPAAVLSRIRWSVNLLPVTGCRTLDDDEEAIPWNDATWGEYRYQRFVIDADTELSGLIVRLRQVGADGNVQVAIVPEVAGVPSTAYTIGGTFTFAANTLGGAHADKPLLMDESAGSKRRSWIAAGTYYLLIGRSGMTAGTVYISTSTAGVYPYPHGCLWQENIGTHVWTRNGRTARFAILGMPAGEKQPEAPTGSAAVASAGDLKIVLDNTTPRTPAIVRATQEHIYWLQPTLKNDDTLQELALGIVPSLISEYYDQTDGWWTFGNVVGDTKVGMGFKVGAAQTVPFIWAMLKKVGAPVDNVTLEIQNDDGAGKPNGVVIANGTATPVDGATLDTIGTWVQFIFATPPSLVAGTQYHVVIARSGAIDAAKYYLWQRLAAAPGDGYPFGDGTHYDGAAWTTISRDFDFRIGFIPTITIDCEEHTVIRSDTGENVPGLLTPSDEAEWLRLGAQPHCHLRYTEAGVGTVKVKTLWRDPWA